MNYKRLPAFSFVLWVMFASISHSKDFQEILSINGVKKVSYIEPFLFVVMEKYELRDEVREHVTQIKAANKDKDLSKIKDIAILCYYDENTYAAHKRELTMIKNAKSMQGLFVMQRYSPFTSVYTIDKESRKLTESRLTYHRQAGRIGYKLLNRELLATQRFIGRLSQKDRYPDMLIVFSYIYSGVLVYPVYDGFIHIDKAKLGFQRFEKRLKAYPVYENPNKLME